ncbi:hypothetical protein MXM82_04465 [Pseudomonas asiatica]|uniref:hypothetical protein n=1 Tax=Pseudomonas asiatica TaxID=2219225 RepID=UPI002DB691DC|nr:hypothetical protein [Pseudomonas asiatica]MEB6588392.1 hypothetical protein [Pseudomonas asiatica]
MSRPLPLYRTLPANLPAEAPLEAAFAFSSANGDDPGARDTAQFQFSLGTDSDWSADTHDLLIRCNLANTEMLKCLFEDRGVVANDGELLLALEWTSADSCWRKVGKPYVLTTNSFSEDAAFPELVLHLPAGSVRGSGSVSIQLFLGDPGSSDGTYGLARLRGFRLGQLRSVEIVIDGDGSLFPVLEESLGNEGPLWELRTSWSDPRDEAFQSDYVALVLNRDHELFSQLRERASEPGRQSPLMRQIVSSWIALLVDQVKSDLGPDFNSIVNHYGQTEDFASIADAVAAFIRLGQLDASSLSSLFISTQCWFDRRLRATVNIE